MWPGHGRGVSSPSVSNSALPTLAPHAMPVHGKVSSEVEGKGLKTMTAIWYWRTIQAWDLVFHKGPVCDIEK